VWAISLPARFDATYSQNTPDEEQPSLFRDTFDLARQQLGNAVGAVWNNDSDVPVEHTANEITNEGRTSDETDQPPLFEVTEEGIVFEGLSTTSMQHTASASTTATSTVTTTTSPERKPQVILIGTTTRQKAE
jgi:hypothetical protein